MSVFNPNSASSRILYREMQKLLPHESLTQIKSWARVFNAAIHNIIADGKPLELYGVGQFKFKKRKGRTITWPYHVKTKGPLTVVQKDSLVLKFRVSKPLRKKFQPKP